MQTYKIGAVFAAIITVSTHAMQTNQTEELVDAINNSDIFLVQEIIKSNPMLVNTTRYGDSMLHIAAYAGHYEICALLIAGGAAINVRNDFGGTPLHKAVLKNHVAICALLIDHGADVNATNDGGRTPLHYAISSEVCTMLIDKGAHKDVIDIENKTPIFNAAENNNFTCVECLINNGANPLIRHKGLSVLSVIKFKRAKKTSKTIKNKLKQYILDNIAETESCAICLQEKKTLTGSHSIMSKCCNGFMCKDCKALCKASKSSCPLCRQEL